MKAGLVFLNICQYPYIFEACISYIHCLMTQFMHKTVSAGIK